MRHWRFKIIVSLAAAFAASFLAAAPVLAQSGEEISSFASDITVDKDGTIQVTEKIDYFFPTPRHGIYRDLPIQYVTEKGTYFRAPIAVGSVTDASGRPLKVSRSDTATTIRLMIGDPQATVVGHQTYVINYVGRGELRYFKDHDELYWNVTGSGWTVPIRHSSAAVHLPDEVEADSVRRACYTGPKGSTAKNCVIGNSGSTTQIAANDALTIVVGWPPGIVSKLEPAVVDYTIQYALAYVVPLLMILMIPLAWLIRKKNLGLRTLVVQYDPPDGIPPAEVALLYRLSVKFSDVSATIVDLAVHGYLNIRADHAGEISGQFEFTKNKKFDDDPALTPYEKDVLYALFLDRDKVTTKELEQQYAFESYFRRIKREVADRVMSRGYFESDPYSAAFSLYLKAAAPLICGSVLAAIVSSALTSANQDLNVALSWLLPLFICVAAGLWQFRYLKDLEVRTPKGIEACEHARGFLEYLGTAEKYRLQWQEKENIFETFLPHAMVFGVVDKWAQAFKDMNVPAPKWYSDDTGAGFNTLVFARSLDSFSRLSGNAISAVKPPPESSRSWTSSGGSGFGGGSSGGGSGGGGGGSW